MSKAFKVLFLFLWPFCSLFLSCERPEPGPVETGTEPPGGGDTTKIPPKPRFYDENTWIYRHMTMNYLWAAEMPDEDSTDKDLEPVAYFYSLLNEEKDRYSYGKERYEDIADYWNGQLEAYGFRYKQLREGAVYKAVVSLVLKGSPAEEAGLQRGDWIAQINGEPPAPNTIERLLAEKSAVFSLVTPEDSAKTLSMAKRRFQMDPLQLYKILEWRGKKVGYLVFTQFLFNYEAETRRIFQHFKDNGIDEMIIDLRFNPGGVTPIAEVMASLLGPDLGSTVELFHGTGNAYENQQAIQNGTEQDARRYFTDETANLSGLSRLFVITSRSSASSSELVINCLRPYRPVITVGGSTYGKNVISVVIKPEQYDFALMPAWRTILNANNESAYGNVAGIPADYPVEENILPYKPLGDSTETLLRAALTAIGGAVPEQKEEVRATVLDGFHHFDTGTGFLGNKRYNP